MKSIKIFTGWLFAGVVMLNITSCKKFIKEELVTTLTEDYYKTDAGLEDLVKSAYTPLQWKFTGEQSYCMSNFGTDEFREGDQFNNVRYNDYDANLNSNDAFVNDLWINNYAGIRRCNQGIEMISAFDNSASSLLGTKAKRDLRVAEMKALRGFYYFQLIQQLGGVPLVLSVPKNPQYEFPRATEAEVYNQIIADLKEAAPVLPWRYTSADRGRATRAMASHYLAKVYLTRGSAVSEQRGQKATDMDSAIYYANEVIVNSGHTLETDFGNLFSAAYPDGTIAPLGQVGSPAVSSKAKIDANNASNEIIFAAQFSSNLSLAGTNNTTHLYYPGQYDAGIPGMVRDFFNGRPFRRLRPTDYTIDVFDKINDSRFFKTFQTVFYRNVASNNGLATFTAANAPNPALVGLPRVMLGDTAGLYIVNPASLPLLTSQIAAMRYYAVFTRFKQTSASAPVTTDFNGNKYLSMIKLSDPIRLTNTNNEAKGIRNGTFARLAETYLIIAEAYGRKGDYGTALNYVNILRKRAAYKLNESRSPQIWRFMGGPSTLDNTEASNLATTTLFTTDASTEMYPAGVTSTSDRFIHFMLNERTRELCGEFYRWEDLVRTETLFARTKLFNADISPSFASFHKRRPIPYLQMIAQQIDGKPMTAEQLQSYQNPGY
ncbi:MAG TPA: RagB/SusD family nutrient uptake outer membrane protein [Niabella sp.]|nr:RagB/SusD family nutrient uptake outer membrane protein [Niabella sp.]HQW13754.1 RagB/SusD family nutrient uptake outer membrane protein [Niabella sp.]HQX19149.1 RagB/SusD family nutrient uptake outer membrane protein [Niabella sp.]HRB34300.1 RagB/SusD family nutrient uptake outer membrane protein [Niabella sp.]HRB41474.1 RagB/SusD family nutrient uptake outer membrane protein [Niabella sp.]